LGLERKRSLGGYQKYRVLLRTVEKVSKSKFDVSVKTMVVVEWSRIDNLQIGRG
jgi:hypothetical protein